MTEAFEIAATLPPLPRGATLDDARAVVRRHLADDETETLIDEIAYDYWEIWKLKRA